MNDRKLKGFWGAVLLFFGTFLPLVGIPFIGNFSYHQLSREAGGAAPAVLLVFVALITAAFSLSDHYKPLWVTGSLSLLLVGVPFLRMVAESAPVRYGWIVLFAGVALIIPAAGNFPLMPKQLREAVGLKGLPELPKSSPPSAGTKLAYCCECGTKLSAGVRFCQNCGARV